MGEKLVELFQSIHRWGRLRDVVDTHVNDKPVYDNPWVAKILPIFDCKNTDFTKFGSQDPYQITVTEVIAYLG